MKQLLSPNYSDVSLSGLMTLTDFGEHSTRTLVSKGPEQKVVLRLDGWCLLDRI